MLSGDNVYTLISYLSVSRSIFLAVAAAVIPYHRLKYPDVRRPFTVISRPTYSPTTTTLYVNSVQFHTSFALLR